MSLVGTRPPTVDEWDKYELHHRARLATKPGLTGMWQVSGRSNITDLHMIIMKQVISSLFSFHSPLSPQAYYNTNLKTEMSPTERKVAGTLSSTKIECRRL